jgi:hypothetical protein
MTSGAQFAVLVDGKTRSYRDTRDIALDAATYLKERHPNSEVAVRDLRDNSVALVKGEGFGPRGIAQPRGTLSLLPPGDRLNIGEPGQTVRNRAPTLPLRR